MFWRVILKSVGTEGCGCKLVAKIDILTISCETSPPQVDSEAPNWLLAKIALDNILASKMKWCDYETQYVHFQGGYFWMRHIYMVLSHIWRPWVYMLSIPFYFFMCTLIARFNGPVWGPSGADRTQVGPMLAPWTLLFGYGSMNITQLNGFISFLIWTVQRQRYLVGLSFMQVLQPWLISSWCNHKIFARFIVLTSILFDYHGSSMIIIVHAVTYLMAKIWLSWGCYVMGISWILIDQREW